MKAVLSLALSLALAQLVAGNCGWVNFTTTFVPSCDVGDLSFSWPDYENPNAFYECAQIHLPVLRYCKPGLFYSHIYQRCGTCENYVPPVECDRLRTEYPPKCYEIVLPTPKHPLPTTPTPTTITTMPTTTWETSTTTPISSTTTTSNPTKIPPPPIVTTPDPSRPFPPTPEPTPPSVGVKPPTAPHVWANDWIAAVARR